eukprot:GHVO01066573.1.p1 GENE.GHVO01066573.1~~GHVO01066573.1.p1  ORF type:complete len:359 (+),score=74.48 GHVO01066573.1:599-1675(+)
MLVNSFDPASHIYSFDLAMPQYMIDRFVYLFNKSASAFVYVTFRKDMNTFDIDAVMTDKIGMGMIGSGEGHSAYIYVKRSHLVRLDLMRAIQSPHPRPKKRTDNDTDDEGGSIMQQVTLAALCMYLPELAERHVCGNCGHLVRVPTEYPKNWAHTRADTKGDMNSFLSICHTGRPALTFIDYGGGGKRHRQKDQIKDTIKRSIQKSKNVVSRVVPVSSLTYEYIEKHLPPCGSLIDEDGLYINDIIKRCNLSLIEQLEIAQRDVWMWMHKPSRRRDPQKIKRTESRRTYHHRMKEEMKRRYMTEEAQEKMLIDFQLLCACDEHENKQYTSKDVQTLKGKLKEYISAMTKLKTKTEDSK